MKSKILNKMVFTDFKAHKMDENASTFSIYKKILGELEEKKIVSYSFDEFLEIARKSKFLNLFVELFDDIKIDRIYKSHQHGILHNERVGLFVLCLSTLLDLSEKDFRVLMFGAMYHDIGRQDDLIDDGHGCRSANMLDTLDLPLNEEDSNILKAIVKYHSLRDSAFVEFVEQLPEQDKNRYKLLYSILKDSDGLDRTRLSGDYAYIDMGHLRNKESLKLLPTAYTLEYNYKLEEHSKTL